MTGFQVKQIDRDYVLPWMLMSKASFENLTHWYSYMSHNKPDSGGFTRDPEPAHDLNWVDNPHCTGSIFGCLTGNVIMVQKWYLLVRGMISDGRGGCPPGGQSVWSAAWSYPAIGGQFFGIFYSPHDSWIWFIFNFINESVIQPAVCDGFLTGKESVGDVIKMSDVLSYIAPDWTGLHKDLDPEYGRLITALGLQATPVDCDQSLQWIGPIIGQTPIADCNEIMKAVRQAVNDRISSFLPVSAAGSNTAVTQAAQTVTAVASSVGPAASTEMTTTGAGTNISASLRSFVLAMFFLIILARI